MNTSESFRALRRANPRARHGFSQAVEAAAGAVQAEIAYAPVPLPTAPQRRLAGVSAAAALATAAVVASFLTLGSPRGGTGVEDATAAFQNAAAVTAAAAERSGTAVVRIRHNGTLWAGSTIRWHGRDLAITQDTPDRRGKVGSRSLVVDGIMYGVDPEDGGWVVNGSTESIDPDSGTTPDETLAAIREDVGGPTLQRITGGMTASTPSRREDGSTVYSGAVAAGLIARETGFKEGQAIRVLPFGYVAHDEAADPAAPLDTAVTVGADGIVREIAVTWGGGWAYTVAYRGLGSTAAPVAPTNPRPLRRRIAD
jgi:hypothetical protein